MILVRSVKARIVCSYYSIVFKSSSVYLLCYLIALGAFRRNYSIALIFRSFYCNLFYSPFIRSLLGILYWGIYKDRDENCDPGSYDSCDSRSGSGYYDECDSCDASWDPDSYKLFRFLKGSPDGLWERMTTVRPSDKSCNCLRKLG